MVVKLFKKKVPSIKPAKRKNLELVEDEITREELIAVGESDEEDEEEEDGSDKFDDEEEEEEEVIQKIKKEVVKEEIPREEKIESPKEVIREVPYYLSKDQIYNLIIENNLMLKEILSRIRE